MGGILDQDPTRRGQRPSCMHALCRVQDTCRQGDAAERLYDPLRAQGMPMRLERPGTLLIGVPRLQVWIRNVPLEYDRLHLGVHGQ